MPKRAAADTGRKAKKKKKGEKQQKGFDPNKVAQQVLEVFRPDGEPYQATTVICCWDSVKATRRPDLVSLLKGQVVLMSDSAGALLNSVTVALNCFVGQHPVPPGFFDRNFFELVCSKFADPSRDVPLPTVNAFLDGYLATHPLPQHVREGFASRVGDA